MTRTRSKNARVEFHKHPPERRHGGEARVYCGGCCCCCCLHSLGGLIGAAAASRRKPGVLVGTEIDNYWVFLVLLTGLTVILSALLNESSAWGFVMVLMVMPAIQLVCSLVAAIWGQVRGGEIVAEKRARLRTIGKITLWSFIGMMVGLLAMIAFAKMMN